MRSGLHGREVAEGAEYHVRDPGVSVHRAVRAFSQFQNATPAPPQDRHAGANRADLLPGGGGHGHGPGAVLLPGGGSAARVV